MHKRIIYHQTGLFQDKTLRQRDEKTPGREALTNGITRIAAATGSFSRPISIIAPFPLTLTAIEINCAR
jgi:hypothetical protein